jgi:hypothetical protein
MKPRVGWSALVLAAVLAPAGAAEPFRFPEGKHGKGELRYRNGIPVLTVAGTPEEMGEQAGVLAVKPVPKLVTLLEDFLKVRKLDRILPLVKQLSKALYARFPEEYRREVEAVAKGAGQDVDLVILGNTVPELMKLAGCSAFVVEAGRSRTGAPLVGRNWDFTPLGVLHEYSLVTVYRPDGKRPFAVVGLPGLLTGGTAVNDAGLLAASNEANKPGDGSPAFEANGLPFVAALRRLMERCDGVAAAEKYLREVKPTASVLLTVCDAHRGAVFEVTPKSFAVRGAEDGLCLCTNHFRARELATDRKCWRYDQLVKLAGQEKFAVADVARVMHAVNQGEATLQSMVLEPAALRLHVAFGKGPASGKPLRVLELKPLLQGGGLRRRALRRDRSLLLPRGGVPQPHRAVGRPGGQRRLLGPKGQRPHHPGVPRQRRPLLAGRDVPEHDRAVLAAGGERLARRREGQAVDADLVAAQLALRLPRRHVPQADARVRPRRRQGLAVGRQGQTRQRADLAVEALDHLLGLQVPHLDQALAQAGDQVAAVVAERQAQDGALAPFEVGQELPGLGVPELQLDDEAVRVRVAGRRRQRLAVGRKGQGGQRRLMALEGGHLLARQVAHHQRPARAARRQAPAVAARDDARQQASGDAQQPVLLGARAGVPRGQLGPVADQERLAVGAEGQALDPGRAQLELGRLRRGGATAREEGG